MLRWKQTRPQHQSDYVPGMMFIHGRSKMQYVNTQQ